MDIKRNALIASVIVACVYLTCLTLRDNTLASNVNEPIADIKLEAIDQLATPPNSWFVKHGADRESILCYNILLNRDLVRREHFKVTQLVQKIRKLEGKNIDPNNVVEPNKPK